MRIQSTTRALIRYTLTSGLIVLLTSCSTPTSGTTTVRPDSTDQSQSTTTVAPTSTMPVEATTTTERAAYRVLVFHKTAGYRHSSIEAGLEAIEEIGQASGLEVDSSEDAGLFDPRNLSGYLAIVFLNTTGDILNPRQQEAMERFVGDGGGFLGIHAAADTEYDWPWYGELVGAYFESHPDPQSGLVRLVAGDHDVAEGVPSEFEIVEEWYNFESAPPDDVTVLATVDESTYEGGTMGDVHPIVWAHDHLGGRAVYVGFGHDGEAFSHPAVRDLLANAILWSAGEESR